MAQNIWYWQKKRKNSFQLSRGRNSPPVDEFLHKSLWSKLAQRNIFRKHQNTYFSVSEYSASFSLKKGPNWLQNWRDYEVGDFFCRKMLGYCTKMNEQFFFVLFCHKGFLRKSNKIRHKYLLILKSELTVTQVSGAVTQFVSHTSTVSIPKPCFWSEHKLEQPEL